MATINGNNGNNTLTGTNGDDVINAQGGNDTVNGLGGQDTIDGGSGNDTIDGGTGNDTITGGSGNDHIHGGSDNDVVHGGTGTDQIWGDSGNDQLYGEDDDDMVNGGTGDDLVDGGNGNDTLYGDIGNDIINGGSGDDTIDGGDGNDIVHGGTGNDDIQGGAGNDQLFGEDGNDTIDGGSGDDQIYGGSGIDILSGGTGNDIIHGGADSDIISGGDGNDTIYGEGGADLIDGGNGDDTAVYNASITEFSFYRLGPVFFVVHLGGTGSEGADALINVEHLVFSDAVISTTGNNAPIAFDDVAATNEDAGTYSSGSASVLDNDFDVEHDPLTVTPGTFAGTYGTLTLNANGTYTYVLNANAQTLAQGQVATDSFNYTVSDGSLTDTGKLTVSITGVNDAPVAHSDAATTSENSAVMVNVLANDTDVDNGAVLTVTSASAPPGQGTAAVIGNQVRFDPGTSFDHLAQGATQVVLVNYSITDQFGATSSSTVSITVTGTNDGPVAQPDTATTSENASVDINVLANDTDIDDGAALSVVSASAPSGQGSATVVGNQVRFNPGSDFDYLAVGQSTVVTVNYTMQDQFGAQSSSTIAITVTGTNDAPVANPDIASTSENAAVLVNVLANDTDADSGAVLTVTSASAPAGQGSATVVGNQVRFDPGTSFDYLAAGQTAVVNVAYSIQDQFGATASSTIAITVTGTNDGPVANPDTATTSENAVVTVNVLANDTDVDSGAVLTVTSATAPPGQGSATVVGNQVRFDPGTSFDYLAVGQSTVVNVAYTIQDDHGATSSSTIAITVTGTNDAPVANPDTATTSENAAVLVNVLANDTDADSGAVLTVTSASAPPGQGSATVVGNQVRFDPGTSFDYLAAGQTAVVNVTYSIQDQFGATASSTIAITVTGTNDAPVAVPDIATTSENAVVTVNVLANDTDVDSGAVLTVTSASAPSGQGSASVVGNQVQFNPGTDFDHLAVGESQVVTVTYSIQDEHGASSSSTVAITVTGTNDAPVIDAGGTTATGDVTELPNNAPGENVVVHHADGVIDFTDVDTNDVHSATATPGGPGYYGSLVLDPVNESVDSVGWHYSVSDAAIDGLAAGQTVVQTYDVAINDGHGGIAHQTVTITLHGAADASPPDGTNWYIDNSAIGSTQDGSADNPYLSIAAFNAAQGTPTGPGVNDNVFLLAGTGTYAEADGINLLNGQVLTGVPNGALRPTIVATAGDGVDLAQNNTVQHVDIGNTSGVGISDGGTSVGTLNISDVAKSGSGQIIDVDQGGTIHVSLNSATSTSSSGGAIDLNALSGDFTVTGATNITGATGGGVDVTAGVNFLTNFQGGLSASSGSTTAVNFSGNAGSSALAIAGGLAVATTTGAGLQVQSGGSVTVTGGGNTIATTGGSAVVISNSTIGGAGVTLQSASSVGGSADGIILDSAGGGGFTVTGTASTAGSGGTIANKTGADGLTLQGNGVYINATSNVSLDNMSITGNANHGILGNNVTGFTLTDSSLSGNGSSLAEGGVVFNGLFGTSALLGDVIGGSAGDNVRVTNSAGTLNLTIADSASDQAIVGTVNNVTGNDGVHLETSGAASLTAMINGVDFQGARSDLLETNALGNSTHNITITDSHFNNLQTNTASGGGGVVLRGGGTNSNITVDYHILNSTFTGAEGSAINSVYTAAAGTIRGHIEGNVIGINDGVAGSQGSSGGDGITTGLDQSTGPGHATYLLDLVNNSIQDIAQGAGGIAIRSNGGGAGDGAVVEATLTGNSVDELGDFTGAALYALVGGSAGSGDFAKLGLSLHNNVFNASDAGFGDNAIWLDQVSTDAHFYFPGYTGSADGEYNGGTASVDLNAFLTDPSHANILSNGAFPSFPGGVDAGIVSGVTGDPFGFPIP